jgi:dihydrofolate synthase/folylpolyglutamate synthase
MNYSQALLYLKKVQENGSKLDLLNIQNIIDHLPFNLNKINFIQIAGTNGKGSTSHFVTSILQSANFQVGLFTSPHLQDIRERITINKKWISKNDFSKSLAAVKKISENLIKKKVIENMPTFFEHIFLTSLYHFHSKKVNFAVFEVGLGGRLDATSTITPEVSVITNISYDHTKTLGRRIKDIAFEKAGIIKDKVPVVCGCNPHSISKKVIETVAKQKNSPFHRVLNSKNALKISEKENYYHCDYRTESDKYTFKLFLNGIHQVTNASIAIKVIELLNKKGFNISKQSIYQGIRDNFVPGRIEIIRSAPGVILDGGHNVASIKALGDFLIQKKMKNLTLLFGVLRDKNYKKMINILLPFIKRVVITQPVSKRAYPAEKLIRYFEEKHVLVRQDLREAFKTAQQFKEDILITGSLYLVGEMRNIILGGTKYGYN